MKFFDYINDRDGRVTLTQIEAPKTEWKSAIDVFEDALKHEQKVTGLINDISNLAYAEKDFASHDFLEWFVREQVEEESVARTIVDQLKLIGGDGTGLYMIDQQLANEAPPRPRPLMRLNCQTHCRVRNRPHRRGSTTHERVGYGAFLLRVSRWSVASFLANGLSGGGIIMRSDNAGAVRRSITIS